MIKSLAEQEFEYLSRAWELHLSGSGDPVAFMKAWEHHPSGLINPIAFIGRQRPPYYHRDYKSCLFVAAEDNRALIGDFGSVECFIVGC